MKKILLFVTTMIVLAGCTKESVAPESTEMAMIKTEGEDQPEQVRATVEWTSDPAVDGLGWVLEITEGKVEVPNNLPADFKKDGLQVLVSYKVTHERVQCRCAEPKYYVYITSINVLNA